MSNISELIKEMNSTLDGLLEVERETIPPMKKNFPEFVDAYKGLVTGQSTEVIRGYIKDHVGDYIAGEIEGLSNSVASLGMVVYKGTKVAQRSDEDITKLYKHISEVQSEVEQIKEVFISSSKETKVNFSSEYNQILPVAKNLDYCDIETGISVSIFDVDNDGKTLDCVCPSSYEAFYTYEDNSLEYAGCILKTEKCMYTDKDNSLEFFVGETDGVCYANIVVD
ncbi:MAG: hypothetical protein N4A31_02585 [Rickettsiales bacterium]|jgi:hypothetical protein|nr:hypothetical protein [Rickettsiales bacterium]